MDDVISELGAKVQASTGHSVGIGQPELLDVQLVLWPWRIELANSTRNIPHRPVDQPASAPERQMTAFVLLLSKAGLSCLVDAAKAVSGYTVVTAGESTYVIHEYELPADLQIAILGAARVPLQPALCYTITG